MSSKTWRFSCSAGCTHTRVEMTTLFDPALRVRVGIIIVDTSYVPRIINDVYTHALRVTYARFYVLSPQYLYIRSSIYISGAVFIYLVPYLYIRSSIYISGAVFIYLLPYLYIRSSIYISGAVFIYP